MTELISDTTHDAPVDTTTPATPLAGRHGWRTRLTSGRPPRAPMTPQWKAYLRRASVAYLISRICVLAGAAVVAAQRVVDDRLDGIPRPSNAVGKISDVLTSWDGKWYFALIRDSYPDRVPKNVTWDDYQARTAFFPIYPDLVRYFDKVLPGGDVLAALVLNFFLGAMAIYVTGLIARELFGAEIGYRTMVLMALFPGSFVLSFTYSEATLLALASGCLLCLHRKHWLAAGILASVAAATRPNGIALIAACGVAALIAIKQDRAWRSLIAPLLAPIGFVSFHLFLWHRTGEQQVWFRTQGEAWDEGTSFGLTAIKNTIEAFTKPLSSPTDIVTAVSFLATIVLVYALWKRRLPWPMVTYCAVVLLLMLAPSTVTARPRFLYTAFPLLISAAAWLHDIELRRAARADDTVVAAESHELWTVVLALCAAGIVTLTGLYGVIAAIP